MWDTRLPSLQAAGKPQTAGPQTAGPRLAGPAIVALRSTSSRPWHGHPWHGHPWHGHLRSAFSARLMRATAAPRPHDRRRVTRGGIATGGTACGPAAWFNTAYVDLASAAGRRRAAALLDTLPALEPSDSA